MHIAQFFTNRCNMKRNILLLIFFLIETAVVMAGTGRYTVSGRVLDEHDLKPLPYATVKVLNLELWAITDEGGAFTIANVPEGATTLEITTLGYVTRSISFALNHNTDLKNIRLKEDNLSLPGVEVTARKQSTTGTTTYTLDRTTLDHSQVLSLNDIMSLLPGGQTVNSTLMNDTRLALRSSTGERGNAAFGTAIEVDGMRLDNNASMSETQSASTRNVAASNIESVEVIAGIPGVEYGDVSNGVVKVNTRRGHSPWIVEASVNPYTRQVALSKGLTLGHRGGTLNFSLEHASSFADIASPHTAYNRNILSATYSKAFALRGTTLNLTAGLTGNIGGYNSEADPDAFRDTYQRQRDNLLRGNMQLDWLCNTRSAGVFNVNLQAAFSCRQALRELCQHLVVIVTGLSAHHDRRLRHRPRLCRGHGHGQHCPRSHRLLVCALLQRPEAAEPATEAQGRLDTPPPWSREPLDGGQRTEHVAQQRSRNLL